MENIAIVPPDNSSYTHFCSGLNHEANVKDYKPPTIEDIIKEPLFWSADIDFALEHGGPLLQSIFKALDIPAKSSYAKKHGLNMIVDTRSHMLMPGQYPAIPGWHCDNVERQTYDGQPDISKLDSKEKVYICNMSTDETGMGVSRTEILSQDVNIAIDKDRVWESVHDTLDFMEPMTYKTKDGQILHLRSDALHRASPATMRGWRLFFRLSLSRNKPIGGFQTRPAQIYLTKEGGGW